MRSPTTSFIVIGASLAWKTLYLLYLTIIIIDLPSDTCAPDWVSTRDNLIISSFVFSLLTLLIVIIAGVIIYSQGRYARVQRGLFPFLSLSML